MKAEAKQRAMNSARSITLLAVFAVAAGLLLAGCPVEQVVRNVLADPGIQQQFKGDAGSAGPQGAQGQQGEAGQVVPPLPGPEGPEGEEGPDGPLGPEGEEGPDGPQGLQGDPGQQGNKGDPGISCWDLNGDGVKDPGEDVNGDGLWNALDCQGGAAGNTLDQGYDQGGPGAGRTIIADAGPVEILGDITVSGSVDGVDVSEHAGDASAHHARYRDDEAWQAVLARDGSGSGLDADKLDGEQASAFGRIMRVRGGRNLEGDGTSGTVTIDLKDDISLRSVNATATIFASGDITTNAEMFANGDISTSARFAAAGDVFVGGRLDVDGNIQVENDLISGRDIHASRNLTGASRVSGDQGLFNSITVADRVLAFVYSGNRGAVTVRDGGGNRYHYLGPNGGSQNPLMTVIDRGGTPQAGFYINTSGQGVVFKDICNFRMPNPNQPGTEIWYASAEGPEAAAYMRGTAELVGGTAFVPFPEHFRAVASQEGVTVQLTPRSGESKGLAVVDRGIDGFEVRELFNGTGSYEFDYIVMAVRKGYEDYRVIRDASEVQLALPLEHEDDDAP